MDVHKKSGYRNPSICGMSEQCDTSSHSRESGVPGRSHCLHVVSRAFIRVLGDRRRLSEAEAQRFASKNGLTESRKDIQSSPQKEQKTKHRSCDDRFILARARHALSKSASPITEAAGRCPERSPAAAHRHVPALSSSSRRPPENHPLPSSSRNHGLRSRALDDDVDTSAVLFDGLKGQVGK